MGGPTSMVLLPRPLTDAQKAEIRGTIDAVSNDVKKRGICGWEFWVSRTRPIGGDYVGEGRPFAVAARPPELEPHVSAVLLKEFGFTPQQGLQLDARCNGKKDHSIMGSLLHHLAKSFGGLVDLNGAILPYLPEGLHKTLLQGGNWPDLEGYFDDMVKDMPGKIIGVEYETHLGGIWTEHFADADFIAAWTRHPYFHMIK